MYLLSSLAMGLKPGAPVNGAGKMSGALQVWRKGNCSFVHTDMEESKNKERSRIYVCRF